MKNKHTGSNFDNFLEEEGMLEEVSAAGVKRVLAMEIADAMKEAHVSKSELARRLHTSRTQVDRILNPDDAGNSLEMLFRSAHELGKRLTVRLA